MKKGLIFLFFHKFVQMSVVYNEMLQKKQAMEKLAQQGKRKYEYDSDEDVEVMKMLLFGTL